jgi:hypothetical protein
MRLQAINFFKTMFNSNRVARTAFRLVCARAVVFAATMGLTPTSAHDLYAYSLLGRACCTPTMTEYCNHCGLETKRYNLPRTTCCATAKAAFKRGKCTGLLPPLGNQLYPCGLDCLMFLEQHGFLSILHYLVAHNDDRGQEFLSYFDLTPERLRFLNDNCALNEVTVDRFIYL